MVTCPVGAGEVLAAAADEVVEHHHFRDGFPDEMVDDMRTDQPGASGDQHPGLSKIQCVHAEITTSKRPSNVDGEAANDQVPENQ